MLMVSWVTTHFQKFAHLNSSNSLHFLTSCFQGARVVTWQMSPHYFGWVGVLALPPGQSWAADCRFFFLFKQTCNRFKTSSRSKKASNFVEHFKLSHSNDPSIVLSAMVRTILSLILTVLCRTILLSSRAQRKAQEKNSSLLSSSLGDFGVWSQTLS